jgi:prolyl-tRNA synthetase
MGARVLDRNGKEVMPIMGCYGIGIERILTAAIEQSNDENGFWLPPSIAPFQIVVSPHEYKGRKPAQCRRRYRQAPGSPGFEVFSTTGMSAPGSSSRTPT